MPDKHIYDAMCASECTLSDSIREEAMDLSGCSCLQLSTQPSDATYHTEGDWCVANSGRQVRKGKRTGWLFVPSFFFTIGHASLLRPEEGGEQL